MLLTACTRAPAAQPSPTQPSTPPVETISFGDSAEGLPADEALRALVFAERTAAHARDLEALAQLWAHDAQIIDRRSVDNPADDYRWQGRDAILDRYILAVFPAPPPLFEQPPSLDITFSGDRATATLGRDRWRFTFTEGRWWLQELAY